MDVVVHLKPAAATADFAAFASGIEHLLASLMPQPERRR